VFMAHFDDVHAFGYNSPELAGSEAIWMKIGALVCCWPWQETHCRQSPVKLH